MLATRKPNKGGFLHSLESVRLCDPSDENSSTAANVAATKVTLSSNHDRLLEEEVKRMRQMLQVLCFFVFF